MMLTTDLQFNICNGELSCVLLCATYFFYHKTEMNICFFFEEVDSIIIWSFFLTHIKISADCFSGDSLLLIPVSLKSLSGGPKCTHFYIYKHFAEFIKTWLFLPHATTCHCPLKVKLISALYTVRSRSLS